MRWMRKRLFTTALSIAILLIILIVQVNVEVHLQEPIDVHGNNRGENANHHTEDEGEKHQKQY